MAATLDRTHKKLEHPKWFFMWTEDVPYITTICAWTRRDLIALVSKELDESWEKIRSQGGRAVRCSVSPK